jgi:hypothetical protein
MKRLSFLSLATVFLFLMDSCSTKFNVAAPYKNITVIYGFLDQADTAHYIRIQKAFLDNNKSALVMAQTADSSFYASLNVKIERINFYSPTPGVHDTIHLNRVDLNLEGYPKQPGIFFNSPNYAYKFTGYLDPQYSYRIIVTNPATGEVDSAEAPIIVDTDPLAFNVPYIDDSIANRAGLSFFGTPINTNDVLDLGGTYTIPSIYGTYNFFGQTSPAAVAQMVIRFNWVDSNYVTHVLSAHYADDDLGLTPVKNGGFDFNINDVDIYSAISSAMGTAPANTIRLINRCTLYAYIGTPDYYTYEQIQQSQGTGLTGSEIEPIYTNVKGANALGLFTSKGSRVGNISINTETIDSLISSPLLTNMNIKGTAY